MTTTWEAIAQELNAIPTSDRCDIVRRSKLSALKAITNRNTIIYATDFLGDKARLVNVSIDLTDKEGFIEVTKNLTGDQFGHDPIV